MAFKGIDALISKKMLGGLSPKSLVGPTLMTIVGVSDYRSNLDEGYGVVGSGLRTAGSFALMDVLGMKKYIAMELLTGAPKALVSGYEGLTKQARSMSKMSNAGPFQNAMFNDTPQAYTMRQAGMQMAQASKYNLQQTLLGNEAQYLHR